MRKYKPVRLGTATFTKGAVMIHFFDTDPRKDSPDYRESHGSFGELILNYNDELKKLGYYSELDKCEYVGRCGSLDPNFVFDGKKTFYINVWETANALPWYLVNNAKSVNQRIFGLSDQITKLWRKYGFECETIYGGCNTDFWKPTIPKSKDKFVFLHVNHANVRSGLDLTLQAFSRAFRGNDDVVLIVKDSSYDAKLGSVISKLNDTGLNIEYVPKMMSSPELRDLYSSSHVCLNVIRCTSFGLPLLESSACGCLCVTGDVEPTNEIITPDFGVLIPSNGLLSIPVTAPQLEKNYGLKNYYGNFDYSEEPMFYDFDIDVYAKKLQDIYLSYSSVYAKIDTRTPIIERWGWDKPIKKLVNILSNE